MVGLINTYGPCSQSNIQAALIIRQVINYESMCIYSVNLFAFTALMFKYL